MMPLGPQLMRVMHISPREFSFLVAAYTLSAAVAAFLTALYIDRFDRKLRGIAHRPYGERCADTVLVGGIDRGGVHADRDSDCVAHQTGVVTFFAFP